VPSAASTSASSERAGSAAGKSRSIPSADTSSSTTGPTSRDMETSASSNGAESSGSISSPAVSPASRSASQDNDEARTTNDGSGPSLRQPFAHYDPATSSWRTSQDSWLDTEGWGTSLGIWPSSGMTRSGTAFPLPPSVPRTSAIASGLWPTPTSSVDSGSAGYSTASGRHSGTTLTDAVVRFPTPTRNSYGYNQQDSPGATVRPSLETRSGRWPTPNARDYKGAPGAGSQARGGHQASLPAAIKRWQTPSVADAIGGHRTRSGARSDEPLLSKQAQMADRVTTGSLNPTWVEWLMGFPLGWTDCEHLATRSSRKSSK
jgi:hypothetical protein